MSTHDTEGRDVPARLDITIRTGSGSARTPLAAFDAALLDAGVGDYNLVHLSSVIPRAADIRHTTEPLRTRHGDRLYCVYAAAHAEEPGQTAWAGLGWTRDPTGDGLFVEHIGGSEESVVEQIHLSLGDMMANRGWDHAEPQVATASAHWGDLPACAVVLAAYQVHGWDAPDRH